MEQLGGLGAPDYAAVNAFCRNLKGSVFTLFQHFEGVCAGGNGNNGRGVFRRGKSSFILAAEMSGRTAS